MKNTGREKKKIVSAILVNLSCSIFNICPVNTSLTAAQSRAIANIAVHSSNTRIRAQKVTFPRPRKILTINLPSVSAPSLFSFLYLSYLILPLFALSHSIVFPLSLRPFCVFVSSPPRLPPPPRERRTSLKSFLHLSVSHAGRNADNRLAPYRLFRSLDSFDPARRRATTCRENTARKIFSALARSRCFTFH